MEYITGMMALLWFIFMTFLSHQNGKDTAKTGRWFTNLFKGINEAFLRTIAHMGCFCVLTILILITLRIKKLSIIPGIVGVSFWAWGDEWTKQLVPGRHYELIDTAKNLIGVALGSAGVLLLSL